MFGRDALTNISQLQEYFQSTKLTEAEQETHFDDSKLVAKKSSLLQGPQQDLNSVFSSDAFSERSDQFT